jgi:hypothetical protein
MPARFSRIHRGTACSTAGLSDFNSQRRTDPFVGQDKVDVCRFTTVCNQNPRGHSNGSPNLLWPLRN